MDKVNLINEVFNNDIKTKIDIETAKEREEASKDFSKLRFASYHVLDRTTKSIKSNTILSILILVGLFLTKLNWFIGSALLMICFAFLVFFIMTDIKLKKHLVAKYFTEKIEEPKKNE